MIIDTIDNLVNYVDLNPHFADVVAFLKGHDLKMLEPGRHDIKGDDVFVNIQVAAQRTKETCFLESHIEMIDIQIPISCEETYGYSPVDELPAVAFMPFTLAPGMMVIFFPQDGHAPCIIDQPEIKKAIFKVKKI